MFTKLHLNKLQTSCNDVLRNETKVEMFGKTQTQCITDRPHTHYQAWKRIILDQGLVLQPQDVWNLQS